MGDLGADTAVEQVDDHRFRAVLSRDWEIWGPMGGYVASPALRAVGAVVPGNRPASFSCLYLGVAGFDAVDIEVQPVRAGRTAAFHRASVTQAGKPILEAMVCSVDASASTEHALEHDDAVAPSVDPPEALPSTEERLP